MVRCFRHGGFTVSEVIGLSIPPVNLTEQRLNIKRAAQKNLLINGSVRI